MQIISLQYITYPFCLYTDGSKYAYEVLPYEIDVLENRSSKCGEYARQTTS